jgi:F-type H+-transporting ATPase subunit alpha
MAQFVKFGAEVDQATLDQLTRGEREREILKQDPQRPLALDRQIVALYAAVQGHLDAVPVPQLKAYEQELYSFVEVHAPEVLESIRELKDLTAGAEAALEQAIRRFTEEYLRRQAGGDAPAGRG